MLDVRRTKCMFIEKKDITENTFALNKCAHIGADSFTMRIFRCAASTKQERDIAYVIILHLTITSIVVS